MSVAKDASNISGELHLPRRRNIMRAFKISEISAVDRPAQEGAVAALMKRAGAPDENTWQAQVTKRSFTAEERRKLADEGKALPDGSYPIVTRGDLSNAIQAFGRGGATPRIKTHIIARARTLGATDSLPENWQVSKDGNDNPGVLEMTEKELQKQVADLTAELAKIKADGETAKAKQTELETANADLTAKAAAAADEAKALKAAAAMTQDEKDHCDGMSAKDTADFMAKPAADRKKTMANKRADDETVTIEGQEVRKSVVGVSQFAIMKASAERIAKLEKANQDEIEKRETAELSKRADDEFSHLPGSAAEKVGVLRAIGKADKPVQEVFAKMMQAGDKAITAAYDKLGHRGGSQTIDKGAFEKRIAEVRKRDECDRTTAMETARKEFPQEFAAYQGQN